MYPVAHCVPGTSQISPIRSVNTIAGTGRDDAPKSASPDLGNISPNSATAEFGARWVGLRAANAAASGDQFREHFFRFHLGLRVFDHTNRKLLAVRWRCGARVANWTGCDRPKFGSKRRARRRFGRRNCGVEDWTRGRAEPIVPR